MPSRILVDAAFPEEIRIAVVEDANGGARLKDLFYETPGHARDQVRGDIFLARVTRVEPALQAAFVEYAPGKQGFLSFQDIHPRNFQIPIEDHEALLREMRDKVAAQKGSDDEAEDDDAEAADGTEAYDAEPADDAEAYDAEATDDAPEAEDDAEDEEEEEDSEAALLQFQSEGREWHQRYAIQEVIKLRQLLLVQAVKDPRGSKGAAMTTHISLPGRYCVLMPNTPWASGISQTIRPGPARRALRRLHRNMELPEGVGLILRTAAAKAAEDIVIRDIERLLETWKRIHASTMEARAPASIHREAGLLHRTVRDITGAHRAQIIVEGHEAWESLQDTMAPDRPDETSNLRLHKDGMPIFRRYGVERMVRATMDPTAPLPSGGHLVFSPTEALVAIDVNSGRATKERSMGDTALKTNLEAAEEIARQLRLRDLAGLIVIDFIDMDSNAHNRQVEQRFTDAMRSHPGRLRISRISRFGLLEMSLQRLRPRTEEAVVAPCRACEGSGMVRSPTSASIDALREAQAIITEAATRGPVKGGVFAMRIAPRNAIYLLNSRRQELAALEARFGIHLDIIPTRNQTGAAVFLAQPPAKGGGAAKGVAAKGGDAAKGVAAAVRAPSAASEASDDDQPKRSKRGSRRGRRGRRGRDEDDNGREDNGREDNGRDDNERNDSERGLSLGKMESEDAPPQRAARARLEDEEEEAPYKTGSGLGKIEDDATEEREENEDAPPQRGTDAQDDDEAPRKTGTGLGKIEDDATEETETSEGSAPSSDAAPAEGWSQWRE